MVVVIVHIEAEDEVPVAIAGPCEADLFRELV